MTTATLEPRSPTRRRIKPASERRQFLTECLDLEAASGVAGARFEYFQLALWDDDGIFRIDNKSRQIAWSWAAAADAVADAILTGRDSIFVSINQEEAKEKIRYAKGIHEALYPFAGMARIKRDSSQEMELTNGARLTSMPARPPRGRARSNVYLDEYAHVRLDHDIYTGALPIISKGGRLRIGSSPMGAAGRFWEIFTESMQRYPAYKRHSTPWWHVYSFCQDVRSARLAAEEMPSEERVRMYGNHRILTIFENMPLEDFQQEYECLFVDEVTAWFTWDEIRRNQDPSHAWEKAHTRDDKVAPAIHAIDRLAALIDAGIVENTLAAGMDIGRTRDVSELYAVGVGTTRNLPLRLAITLEAMEFDDQLAVIDYAMNNLPIVELQIDRNGIGMNLAENARKLHPGKAYGYDFTNAGKQLLATDAKQHLQQNNTPLPADRDLAYQIHSIKRQISPSKKLTFDTDREQKHHADKAWAWMLALHAGLKIVRRNARRRPHSRSVVAVA